MHLNMKGKRMIINSETGFESLMNEMIKTHRIMQDKIDQGTVNEFQRSLYKNILNSALDGLTLAEIKEKEDQTHGHKNDKQ